jgi:predicted  nucleic acid-binding Zn-ribbon protein
VVALRSFTPAETMDQAVRALEEMGGWILESETGRAEFRIPAAQLDDALRVLRRTGEVVQEDVKSEDVSMEIATLQGRIDELDRARRRVQELLAVATTTKEALDVEQRLAEITEDLEAQQGRVRFLEQRVAESPLTLGVSMRGRPAPQGVRRRPPFPWVEDYGLDALLRAQ